MIHKRTFEALQNDIGVVRSVAYVQRPENVSHRAWQIYRHTTSITRLYALYEHFAKWLVRYWLEELPRIVRKYEDLSLSLRLEHCRGVGRLLSVTDEQEGASSNEILKIIEGLYTGHKRIGEYTLAPEAFIRFDGNLRLDKLKSLFGRIGIDDIEDWMNKHPATKKFFEDHGSDNTLKGQLDELVKYRNQAAHGSAIDDLLSPTRIDEFAMFVDSICYALLERVLREKILRAVENGTASKIGEVTNFYQKNRVAIVHFHAPAQIACGDLLYLVSQTCCIPTEVIEMRNETSTMESVSADLGMEISAKFDRDCKKGFEIFLCNI